MKTLNVFMLSLSHVKKSKLRSWLTIIGIVIGVAAVVAIISIGQGMQASVQSRLASLGADLITVTPGFSRAGGFEGRSVTGVDTSVWRSMVTTQLEVGRYLQPGDSNAVVIGNSLAHTTFLEPITLNKPVTIGGKTFKVVGIFVSSGGGFGGGGIDNGVYMSANYAREVITQNVSRNQFTSILVKIRDPALADTLTTSITQKLLPERHVNPRTQDFTVTAFAAIQQQITGIVQSISLFLVAIAAVSLIVGAVGIANTMFMSVMERTRQIGLLKALGATDNEVLKLFIIESGLFGFVGGVIGVIFGIIVSVIISSAGLRLIGGPGGAGTATPIVTPELIIFALIFSVFVGIISGIIPARTAAKMNPVDALRFEQ